jgi:hypothetical protein
VNVIIGDGRYILAWGIHAVRNMVIGQLYATKRMTVKQLAAFYGLTRQRIYQIILMEESRAWINAERGFSA